MEREAAVRVVSGVLRMACKLLSEFLFSGPEDSGVARGSPKGVSCCWKNSQRCPEWLPDLFLFGIR